MYSIFEFLGASKGGIFLEKCKFWKLFYDDNFMLKESSQRKVAGTKKIKDIIIHHVKSSFYKQRLKQFGKGEKEDERNFYDLFLRCFKIDPAERITAE